MDDLKNRFFQRESFKRRDHNSLHKKGFKKPKRRKLLLETKVFNDQISMNTLERFGVCEPVKISDHKYLNLYRGPSGIRLAIQPSPGGSWQPGHKLT